MAQGEAGRDAVSPIRRPRAFARALGAMAAQQAGPRGRIVLLRNTVDGRTFCTAHKSQTVYHGPVVSADAPVRRLETASSDLETGHPTTNVCFLSAVARKSVILDGTSTTTCRGCMSEHRRQEPIWTSVRGAGVKAVSPAERGRSEATRLDVGEHKRTLLG